MIFEQRFDVGDVVLLTVTGYTFTDCEAEVTSVSDEGYLFKLVTATDDAIRNGRDIGYTFSASRNSDVGLKSTLISIPKSEDLAPDPNFQNINNFNALFGTTL